MVGKGKFLSFSIGNQNLFNRSLILTIVGTSNGKNILRRKPKPTNSSPRKPSLRTRNIKWVLSQTPTPSLKEQTTKPGTQPLGVNSKQPQMILGLLFSKRNIPICCICCNSHTMASLPNALSLPSPSHQTLFISSETTAVSQSSRRRNGVSISTVSLPIPRNTHWTN